MSNSHYENGGGGKLNDKCLFGIVLVMEIPALVKITWKTNVSENLLTGRFLVEFLIFLLFECKRAKVEQLLGIQRICLYDGAGVSIMMASFNSVWCRFATLKSGLSNEWVA